MIFGKYGQMILTNMENNYPYRKKLELTGQLDIKIFEREQYTFYYCYSFRNK